MGLLGARRHRRRGLIQRPGSRLSPDTIRVMIWGLVIAVSLAAMTLYVVSQVRARHRQRVDPATLCSLHEPTPTAVLMVIDQTDPLARDDGANFSSMVRTVTGAMRRHDRLTIVPFDGHLGRTPTPVFDKCSPGSAAEVNELHEGRGPADRKFNRDFVVPLDDLTKSLMSAHRSERSPIARQIERIVNNPNVRWRGDQRELILVSDGLENTIESPMYAGGPIKLPPPTAGLLQGVKVKFYLLANSTHSNLQRDQVQRVWKEWFEREGATVEIYAPGFVVGSQ